MEEGSYISQFDMLGNTESIMPAAMKNIIKEEGFLGVWIIEVPNKSYLFDDAFVDLYKKQ